MSWTQVTKVSPTWIGADIFNFLLQETGDYLLQEDRSKIALDELSAGVWTQKTAVSGSWSDVTPV